MSSFDLKEFTDPGREWRPTVFWAWNGELSNSELDSQISYMKEQGLGGFFMHSRSGLNTEYMSEEWMGFIRHAQASAREADMNSWLYDEDRWPSGFAGGVVPAGGDEYRMKCIEAHIIAASQAAEYLQDARTLAVFEVRAADSKQPEILRRLSANDPQAHETTAADSRIVSFSWAFGERSNWRNGETYVDLLDPATTDRFLDETYDAYDAAIEFDDHTPGIFTDEPTVTLFSAEKGLRLPWTPGLAEAFERNAGEDLLAQLPALYFSVGEWRRARFFYWKTVCQLFVNSFGRRCYDRADKLGLAFTGHYLFEENLVHQTVSNGAVMPLYEFQHIPGVDQLGPDPGAPITYKQVSSVARQFGRERVVSETLGASGQGMSLESQKAIFDRQLALGVNMFTKHIGLYTMTGERKRDYPPNVHYQQPYSGLTRQFHDYVARCAYAVSAGTAGGGLLVLHPISSAWSLIGGALTPQETDPGHNEVDYETALTLYTRSDDSKNVAVAEYEREFSEVLDWLIAHHFDFDLGDESILASHARVEGATLWVGQQAYRTIAIPPLLNIESGTLALLRDFQDSGGQVIPLGEAPTYVDGTATSTWLQDATTREEAYATLESFTSRSVRILGSTGEDTTEIILHHRRIDNQQIIFVINTDRTAAVSARISICGAAEVTELLPMTGGSSPVTFSSADNSVAFDVAFPPGGSKLFIAENS